MSRVSRLRDRAYWLGADLRGMKERALRLLMPSRMRFVHFSWPLLPELCPCDPHFCDYLVERNVRERAIFHLGTGGHHLVGRRNRDDALGNDVLGITASPSEHARYLEEVIRDPSLGAGYKVLFADVYNLRAGGLPTFDLVTLFHLHEFGAVRGDGRLLDDAGVLDLFLSKLAPGGRLLFYARSDGRRQTQPLIERAVAAGRMTFEEEYRSLLVYRGAP